jgi:site-specific DNA-methyltransferase (adenine-specific)
MSGDQWATPQWLFDYYNKKHQFNLDAAATKENTKCLNFFTKEDNSLNQTWENQIVWCNPPYSRVGGPLTAWVAKAVKDTRMPYRSLIVMLIPADTSTKYFKMCWEYANKIDFWHRIKFVGAPCSAKFGSMVVTFEGRWMTSPEVSVLRKEDICHF